LRRVTCVGLKTKNRERGAGVAVACGSLGDLAIFVDCSDRLVRTSLRDLANVHAAADAVAAAFDAADDAADAASRALFVSTRAELFEASPGSDRLRTQKTRSSSTRRWTRSVYWRRTRLGGTSRRRRAADATGEATGV
jgi:hypothetical protein